MDNSYQNWNKKLLMEEYMNDLNSIIFFFFFFMKRKHPANEITSNKQKNKKRDKKRK